MRSRRVLNTLPTSSGGGAENHVLSVSKRLSRDGRFAISNVCISDRWKTADGVSSFGFSSPMNPLAVIALFRHLRQRRYDIVHCHLIWDQLFVSLAALFLGRRRPVLVATIHTTGFSFSRVAKFAAFLDWLLFRRFDALITVSHAVQDKLLELERYGRIPPHFVINNGVSTRSDSTREMPEGAVNIVFAGRIEPVKNLSLSLRIIKELKQRGCDCRFFIVGDGSLRPSIEREIAEHKIGDAVAITGWKNDVSEYFRRAHVYLSTSLFEGFGLSIAEALSFGVPTVVSNIPGPAQIVGADGMAGYVVRSDAPADFADKIIELTKNREKWGRHSAMAFARSRVYSIDKCADRYAALYDCMTRRGS